MNSRDGNETLPILELNGADTTWIHLVHFTIQTVVNYESKDIICVLITYTHTDNAFRVDSLKY